MLRSFQSLGPVSSHSSFPFFFFYFRVGIQSPALLLDPATPFVPPKKEKKRKKSLLTCSNSPWRKIYLENPEWLRLRSAGRGDRSNFSKLPSFSLPGKLGEKRNLLQQFSFFFCGGLARNGGSLLHFFFISCCLSKSVCLCLMEFCPLWPKTDNSQIDNYFFI